MKTKLIQETDFKKASEELEEFINSEKITVQQILQSVYSSTADYIVYTVIYYDN